MNYKNLSLFAIVFVAVALMAPEVAHATVENSILGLQQKLTKVILPALSICSIAWAAFSMMSGNDKSKSHMWYAIIATVIGFGAEAIVTFIRTTVN